MLMLLSSGYSGFSARQAAAARGYLEVVKRLLEAEADVSSERSGLAGQHSKQLENLGIPQ